MDARDATRTARSIEPLHALGYFSADVDEAMGGLGLRGRARYFVSRAAAMGAVGPGVVTATFYHFHPGLVAHAMTGVWELTTPSAAVEARYRGVDASLRRLLGEDVIVSEQMAEAAGLARRAAEACTPQGRPLYAAHADLAWPDEPHLVLWHALTLLREHRGDGHVATLVGAGVSGLEALITHTATGKGFLLEAAQKSRGWSEDEWDACAASLVDRGLLDRDGALTDDGRTLRRELEATTDRLDFGPWSALGEQQVARLHELATPMVQRALENGALPPGVFASV